MSLNLTQEPRFYKKLFTLKPPQRDGLILSTHHTDKNSQKIRFINTTFDKTGHILALADREGNIFVIDFSLHKFWNIPKVLDSCTIIKFSQFKESQVLAGKPSGAVWIIDVHTGFVCGKLMGHGCPISQISFADCLCLTVSACESILWDLRSNSKVQVLNLIPNCTLKYASFVPVSNDLITCYNDDVIQIWQFGTFEVKNQIPPLVWFNHEVKNITFTLDGKIMVVACRTPHLALFLLSTYKLLKFITLPEYIQTLKHVDFIPQLHDGGSNKILAVLSGRGSIYFYDVDQNLLVSELVANCEILKYDFSLGNFFSCVLCSGDVNIYDVTAYTVIPVKLRARAETPGRGVKLKKCLEKMGIVKEQIREILEIEKLRTILKECGEYPDSYRTTIWEHLLELPNNKHQYNSIINNRMIISFEDLSRKFPLYNKRSLHNLKQLLDNLVTWCPFFLHVDYLPSFVFPFVKVFANKPLTCFEAVCTVIINWCQFWFEYFPLPPVNILAIIENVFMEHDPELLDFLSKKKIPAEVYAWPILRSVFSEVLTATSWKIFWDHTLTNEPSFLLCALVAYNILLRTAILTLKDERQFKCFYNTHHPVDVKRLIMKTYKILAETSSSIHPRQYLNMFKKLRVGEYPNFCDYPKTIIDLKSGKMNEMREEMKGLKSEEIDLFRKRLVSLEKLHDLEVQEEENKRILEMENAVRQQLLDEQERVVRFYERIANLRRQFEEEDKVLGKLQKMGGEDQKGEILRSILYDVKFRRREKDQKLTRREDELLHEYAELGKNKQKIEQLVPDGESDNQLDMSKATKPDRYMKTLNLSTGLQAIDALMRKIELELEKEKLGVVSEVVADQRVSQLKAETRELASEVRNLMQLLADLRNVGLDA